MPKQSISFNDWKKLTEAEYKRRTGMTLQDGGHDTRSLNNYYYGGSSPSEMVDAEIEKYDLTDITKSEWGGPA